MPDTPGALHCQNTEVIATDTVKHDHIKRCGSSSLFIKPPHVKALGIGLAMNIQANSVHTGWKCFYDQAHPSHSCYDGAAISCRPYLAVRNIYRRQRRIPWYPAFEAYS